MSNRSRGLLTERQRQFLRNNESGGSNPRKLRQQIRDRVRVGLEDLALLFDEMEHRDIVQLKQTESDEFDTEFEQNYINTIGFLARTAFANSVPLSPLLEEGISSGYDKVHTDRVLDIDIQIDSRKVTETNIPDLEDFGIATSDGDFYETPSESPDLVSNQHIPSRSKAITLLRANLDLLESGLSPVDIELADSNAHAKPDIIAHDATDQIVLIKIEDLSASSESMETLVQQFCETVSEYGGEGHARGILVSLTSSESLAEIATNKDLIEYVSFENLLIQFLIQSHSQSDK